MRKAIIEFLHPEGLHARPAAELVKVAGQFDCQIFLAYQNRRVNAKSIMGVLSLAIHPGASIELEADGSDEDRALRELTSLLGGDFK
ncbi:MAG: HPr family phosphocarrier protein [Leptospiraceae bacterium]|nr:HPr family phosphocarrier protein [Leptospiraceae bacterium]